MNSAAIAQWASQQKFTSVDYTYATILAFKILDKKCKMESEEQERFMAVYRGMALHDPLPFKADLHTVIKQANDADRIHEIRLELESNMDRPTMKAYKAEIRNRLARVENT